MEDGGRLTVSSAFGHLLRRHRLAAGLSQEALAERARLSAFAISALERGHRRRPQRGTLALLVGALALDGEKRAQFEATARLGQGFPSASVTPGPSPDARAAPLPLALASFIGRDDELRKLKALLQAHRLVTLVGAGGVGKTQTALRAAVALGDGGAAKVYFVSLAPIANPLLVVEVIASALGVQELWNHPLLDTVVEFLRNRAILLILDNCEHVVAEAAAVADSLLRGCLDLRVLATSREPLRVGGECIYRLPSLDDGSAVALFADRAQAADGHFMLTDEDRPIVTDICRRLGGIPLAIELVAARVSILSLRSLAAALDDRFPVRIVGERTASPRQQTMRATIDWSYDLLSAPEQRVFERLSVFTGGCTIKPAEAVCQGGDVPSADVLSLISSLVSKSMLVADLRGYEARYFMLEPFREYAHEKLAIRDEEWTARQRHVLAYIELATCFALHNQHYAVFNGQAGSEIGNWRAAVYWGLTERNDALAGQRLVAEVVCSWGGHDAVRADAERWIPAAMALIDEQTPPGVLAKLKLAEATLAMFEDRHALQLASGRDAISYFRETGDGVSLMSASTCVGNALADLGRATEARTILEEALSLARKLGSRWYIAHILRHLAWACIIERDFVVAHSCLIESLLLIAAEDDSYELDMASEDLAELAFFEGDPESAVRYMTNRVGRHRPVGGRHAACSQVIISGYLIALDRYADARQHASDALVVAREEHLDVLAVQALGLLATIAILQACHSIGDRGSSLERAARLLGFVETRLAGLGSGYNRTDSFGNALERALGTLREGMSAGTVATLMAEGGELTDDQAAKIAARF